MSIIKRVKPPHKCKPPVPRISFLPYGVGTLWGCRKCGTTYELYKNRYIKGYMHEWEWRMADR